jgi:hypothetical protein
MPRDWPVSNPPQFEPEAWPLLKKQALKPALVLHPEDVESYIWSVQRITLRPEATKRMLAVHPDTELDLWWIPHYPFAVRVDGQFLFGGVFDGPMSQMTMDFPVIHGEIIDGRAVLHFLPRQESIDGDDSTKAILVRRRYRRDGTGWKLVLEMHRKCFDENPPQQLAFDAKGGLDEEGAIPLLEGPCWPPPSSEKEPPIPPPVELVQ